MSYFDPQGNLCDVYYLDFKSYDNKTYDNLSEIQILNNQSIKFDLNQADFKSKNTLGNSNLIKIIKITIDWGDGQNDILVQDFNRPTLEWKTSEHIFSTTSKSSTIVVKIFSSCGSVATIKIPYKIIQKTIYDIGSQFKMIDARLTNENNISSVLKNKKKDAIIIVKTSK